MSIEFSQIPDRFNYPRNIKGKLSSLHSSIITFVTGVYDGSQSMRSKTIRLLNTVTRYIYEGDSIPTRWNPDVNPFTNIFIEEEADLKECLDKLYINPKDINWDIQPVVDPDIAQMNEPSADGSFARSPSKFKPITVKSEPSTSKNTVKSATKTSTKPSRTVTSKSTVKVTRETDKRDLYIQPPTVPQFDIKKPWASKVIDGTVYCIYSSVPEIPTKQNEISVSTDVTKMSDAQLLKLYPLNFIRTRSPIMYEPGQKFHYHDKLGLLLPIEGYTEDQLIDNIIQYPHLFKLSKIKDGDLISFYNNLEIDGKLYKISDIWKELPDTAKIPYNADFVKEYVVRRYLLERDVKGIQHKYPMYGELNPYLTLFTTASEYIQLGYPDVVEIARKCVESRVAYKRSRNPVLRRVEGV